MAEGELALILLTILHLLSPLAAWLQDITKVIYFRYTKQKWCPHHTVPKFCSRFSHRSRLKRSVPLRAKVNVAVFQSDRGDNGDDDIPAAHHVKEQWKNRTKFKTKQKMFREYAIQICCSTKIDTLFENRAMQGREHCLPLQRMQKNLFGCLSDTRCKNEETKWREGFSKAGRSNIVGPPVLMAWAEIWPDRLVWSDHLCFHCPSPFTIIVFIITIIINTRPKPAYGRQGLDWIVGQGYSFVVFSTNKTMETNQKPWKTMKHFEKP